MVPIVDHGAQENPQYLPSGGEQQSIVPLVSCPTTVAKIYHDASSLCFGGCGQEGNMLHVWWSCLKVK